MRKFLALTLAIGMLLSFAACSNNSSGSSSTNDTPASTDAGSSASTQSNDEKKDVTLSIFIDHSWYPIEKFEGIIPEEIKAKTGVTLDVTIAIDAAQLGVMMGSGELPDLVYTQTMVDRMSDPILSHSYEDLIAQYGIDWEIPVKQLGIARGLSKDGKAYTLLNHFSEKSAWEGSSAVPMVGSLSYRKDIYETIGKPDMKSFDDLYTVMGTVKEKYPDMIPFQLSANWNTLSLRFLKGMGQLDYIEQPDKSYIHYTKDARYKEIMLWLNKCYLAGYLVPDDAFFVKGSTAIPADKYFFGCTCTQNGIPGANATLKTINPDFCLAELVPFAESSYIVSDTGWSATFITKNNKDPEASIKFIQWMFTPEAQVLTQMGREGIDYKLNASGLPEFSDEWTQAIADGTHNVKFNPWFYLGGSETVEADSRCATTDPALVEDTYKIIRERYDNYPWVLAAAPIGESDEKVIADKIKELSTTYEAKIILAGSQADSEKMYAEYLANAEKIGMSKLEKYVTDKVVEVMPLYK